jgi:hypothetical protein
MKRPLEEDMDTSPPSKFFRPSALAPGEPRYRALLATDIRQVTKELSQASLDEPSIDKPSIPLPAGFLSYVFHGYSCSTELTDTSTLLYPRE